MDKNVSKLEISSNSVSIIGFHGKAFSGKDTSADIISGYIENPKTLAFVKPLKDAAKILFNLTDSQLYDPIEKEKIILDNEGEPIWKIDGKPASPRLILQWLGTNVLRDHVDEDFFLKHMKQRINKCINLYKHNVMH